MTGHIHLVARCETASITEAKNGPNALLDGVKAGETIIITDRCIPVARIQPVEGGADLPDWMIGLERDGLITRGTGKLPDDFFRTRDPSSRTASASWTP